MPPLLRSVSKPSTRGPTRTTRLRHTAKSLGSMRAARLPFRLWALCRARRLGPRGCCLPHSCIASTADNAGQSSGSIKIRPRGPAFSRANLLRLPGPWTWTKLGRVCASWACVGTRAHYWIFSQHQLCRRPSPPSSYTQSRHRSAARDRARDRLRASTTPPHQTQSLVSHHSQPQHRHNTSL